jgi:hypothetical protein
MPRGGGRKVTHTTRTIDLFSHMRFRLWRDDCSLWLRFRTMRRNPIHLFFFLFFRARVYIGGVDLFFLRDDHPSLFLCAAERSRGRSGFPKRALRKRERERDKRMMWFPISPWREKREREDQHTLDLSPNVGKEGKKERKKKTNRQPKHNTSKKERERERERERECFLREKRDIFPPFSLSFLCLPRREERVEKQTDIFRITAWHWPHLSLSLLLLHATMK